MQSITLTDGSNTFTFDQASPGATIGRLAGWEFYAVRQVIEDLPDRDGATFLRSHAGRRTFSWAGIVSGSDRDNWLQRRRNLVSTATQGALKTLQFTTDDDLDLQANVEILDIQLPHQQNNTSYGRYFIEVVAPDYRFQSQTLSQDTTGTTETDGGVAIPTAIPMDLSEASSGSSRLTVTNNGNTKADPVFTITGPGTNFRIQNITTGETLLYNATLASGETLEIDVSERTVLKNGSTNDYGNVSGDFWDIEPGDNIVHFVADSGTDGDTLLEVAYRDSYNGI